MMERRSHWRDKKEWQKSGLEFSTSSDEACKMYDAAVTQYVGWYSDDTLGGLLSTLNKITEADPNAVMGYVMSLGLELIGAGKAPNMDKKLRERLVQLGQLVKAPGTTDWERRHAEAISLFADGHLPEAVAAYERLLLDYPLDMFTIRLTFDIYIYMGWMPQRRDSIARVLPLWTPDIPLYSYLYGLYSFGLCETNEFSKAEMYGKKGLELNPKDAWATHSLVHTYEMSSRYEQGTTLLESTVKNWQPQDSLACHNYWHWAIHHVEQGDYQSALDIFDNELCPRTVASRSGFNVSDSCALLKRVEMEGMSVGERWQDIYEVCRSEAICGDNFCFLDAHYLMCALGAKQRDAAHKLMENINEFLKGSNSYSHSVKREVGVGLSESLIAYDEGDYSKAVDKLHPLKYQVYKIGGSNAQRDVIHQFLIHAALKSPKVEHNKIARSLLVERKALIENSPLTDRLMEQALAVH